MSDEQILEWFIRWGSGWVDANEIGKVYGLLARIGFADDGWLYSTDKMSSEDRNHIYPNTNTLYKLTDKSLRRIQNEK